MATVPFPDRRHSLEGVDLDGVEMTISFCIARKLYTCPGCRARMEIGHEHVLVKFRSGPRAGSHQHWHKDCAATRYIREFTNPKVVPNR